MNIINSPPVEPFVWRSTETHIELNKIFGSTALAVGGIDITYKVLCIYSFCCDKSAYISGPGKQSVAGLLVAIKKCSSF